MAKAFWTVQKNLSKILPAIQPRHYRQFTLKQMIDAENVLLMPSDLSQYDEVLFDGI